MKNILQEELRITNQLINLNGENFDYNVFLQDKKLIFEGEGKKNEYVIKCLENKINYQRAILKTLNEKSSLLKKL